MTLLSVMHAINDKTERVNTPSDDELYGEAPKSKDKIKTGHPEVDGMAGKLNGLDRGEQQLRQQFDNFKVQFDDVSNRVKRTFEDSKPVLEDVFRSVQKLKASPRVQHDFVQEQTTLVEEPVEPATAATDSFPSPWLIVIVGGAGIYLALRFLRRMRRSRGSTSPVQSKGGKIF